ncbi:hypothetical protein N4T77_12665 [Clostridium sp. CX1]|uniref:hypothetical protein n=1 Tax=Clostridium sp. CX1 TaxID=2978346 RepID=UPI0021C142AF|nr:hypothetical protein [Clostridium sp. CX1]MCT8977456.1 hypothetical protein [Clostridium sp. CX1]
MNNLYELILKYTKILKKFTLSAIDYIKIFFKSKKYIDDTYFEVEQNKLNQIHQLELQLKIIRSKNLKLEKELSNMTHSINKKRKLIEGLQDLITRRTE